jgi:hypothetical protein
VGNQLGSRLGVGPVELHGRHARVSSFGDLPASQLLAVLIQAMLLST